MFGSESVKDFPTTKYFVLRLYKNVYYSCVEDLFIMFSGGLFHSWILSETFNKIVLTDL